MYYSIIYAPGDIMLLIRSFLVIVVNASAMLSSLTVLALSSYLLFSKTQKLRQVILSRLMGFLIVLVASSILLVVF